MHKEQIYNYMIEQQKLLNVKHEDFLKNTVKNELNRLQDLFKKANDDLTTSSSQHHQLLSDVTTTTINSCTKACSDSKATIENHSTSMINNINTKIHEAEATAIEKHNNDWKQLNSKMTNTYAKLIKTNQIAIKNNAILEKKLLHSGSHISSLEETMAIQQATIENLSSALDKIEERVKHVSENLTPTYLLSIDNSVRKNITSIVNSHCKDPKVTKHFSDLSSTTYNNIKSKTDLLVGKLYDETFVLLSFKTSAIQKDLDEKATKIRKNACESIEKDLDEKATKIKKNACEYMQNRADTLTASIDMNTNKYEKCDIDSEPIFNENLSPPGTEEDTKCFGQNKSTNEYANTMPTNKLFPNVNPEDSNFFKNTPFPNSHDKSSDKAYFHGRSVPHNEHMRSSRELPHKSQLKDHEYIYTDTNDISKLLSVNVNTFYKIKWNSKYSKEMDIFHFYESLQHMASTCGIPMRDLSEIDESHGVCTLNPSNCVNFAKIYKYMKGALFHRINNSSLWENYAHGWNLVQSNLSDCDGFEVMNDVLAEILPKLNILRRVQK